MTKICVPRHPVFVCGRSASHVFQCNKVPNILIGEELLNIEQEKLDYIRQKHARESHEFHHEDVKVFFFGVFCLTLPKFALRGNCFSAASFKRSLLTKHLKITHVKEHTLSQIYTVWGCKTSDINRNGNGSTLSILSTGHELYWPVTFAET